MSERSYWVGLPVGITVRDDGSISIEVDMSEASSEMSENFEDGNEDGITESQMLMDSAIVDGHDTRSSAASVNIQAGLLGLMSCPARYACPFKTSQLHEMAAHIADEDEAHGA